MGRPEDYGETGSEDNKTVTSTIKPVLAPSSLDRDGKMNSSLTFPQNSEKKTSNDHKLKPEPTVKSCTSIALASDVRVTYMVMILTLCTTSMMLYENNKPNTKFWLYFLEVAEHQVNT